MSQLKVNSIIPVAGVPTGGGGGIIQTIQTIKNDSFSTNATSYTDITGLSVTITPTSSTSKILIMTVCGVGADQVNNVHFMKLVRGSTDIAQPNTSTTFGSTATFYEGTSGTLKPWSFNFIDSPNTTSSTTYKWQIKTNLNTIRINNRTQGDMERVATMIAMEVSA